MALQIYCDARAKWEQELSKKQRLQEWMDKSYLSSSDSSSDGYNTPLDSPDAQSPGDEFNNGAVDDAVEYNVSPCTNKAPFEEAPSRGTGVSFWRQIELDQHRFSMQHKDERSVPKIEERFHDLKAGAPYTRSRRVKNDPKIDLHSAYSYAPLQGSQFRIICISPGSERNYLKCEIIHASLSTPPHHEAISYTWGSDENPSRVQCSRLGQSLLVTQNRANVMRRVRHETRPRKIWIDAICIDQANTHERSHQVNLMGQIYAKAAQVIIYIGEQDNSTSKAMDCIADLHGKIYDRHSGHEVESETIAI